MAKGIKRPTLTGSNYSYLGRFKKAKHIQAGHNTSVDEILNRSPARHSTPTPAPVARGSAAPQAERGLNIASQRSQQGAMASTKKLSPDEKNMSAGKLQQVADINKKMEPWQKVKKRTAKLDARSPSGGGRN